MADQKSDSSGAVNPRVQVQKSSQSPHVALSRLQAEIEWPPHERESITNVPVTPGIDPDTSRSLYNDPKSKGRNLGYFSQGLVKGDSKDSGLSNATSATKPCKEVEATESVSGDMASASPSIAAATQYTMADWEGPRRTSLDKEARTRSESISDIKNSVPELALSGNIISATFTVPYSVKTRGSKEWVLGNRQGQSALNEAFSFLSGPESAWKHTVVAWTGEIEAAPEHDPESPPGTPPETRAESKLPGYSHLSAPVPLDGPTPPSTPAQEGLWVSREQQQLLEQQLSHEKKIKTVPVWLTDPDQITTEGVMLKDQSRWRRYAEKQLYPLFHYQLNHSTADGRCERVQWADYYRMNAAFANKILELYKPGDLVVIHDYFLTLLPRMLRQRLPRIYATFFLHCPWPTSELVRCLPRRREVLEGMLGANLIGFQTKTYSRHFASCCTRILSFPSDELGVDANASRVEVCAYAIGIDADKVVSQAWTPQVSRNYEALRELYKGKKIIVGRDRLDSARGVTKKLVAFERFLELYPNWTEKVVLIQVTSPTTMDLGEEDTNIATRVNELVMHINGTYGSLRFSPVQYYPQYLSRDEYFALLRAADVGLITSVRDGMNTTSLEYIICQRDGHGPLILSEFSGTAHSLHTAININPNDPTTVAQRLDEALSMDADERRSKQSLLYQHVTTQTVQGWMTRLVRKLVSTLSSRAVSAHTPALDRSLLWETYGSAQKRLFMFDYDGTLTPIVSEPRAAVPTERLIRTLQSLAADHRNDVWIISGRDQDFLQQHLGQISQLGFSAEHGSFIRQPGASTWENLAETTDMGWQEDVMTVFQKYTDPLPGSFIERKRCALTWHYRAADPDPAKLAAEQAQKELEMTVAKRWDVDVMVGKMNLEVRPTFINKGEIVKRLVKSYSKDGAPRPPGSKSTEAEPGKLQFVFCAGDDFTDEDMFRALNGLGDVAIKTDQIFSCTVGPSSKVTLAKYYVLEPEDIVEATCLLATGGKTSL